ncbi:MAG: DUF5020 family protein [Bacteroidales bacterium]
MKKFLFLFVSMVCLSVSAQNLQLHYDFRGTSKPNVNPDGDYLTATFEMFKADKLGNTFMFIDADFNVKRGNIGLMYAEISREFTLGKLPIAAHIEFNGGVANWGSIDNAYLAGIAMPFSLKNFFFNTYVVYKLNNYHVVSNDVQATVVWNGSFFNDRMTFNGHFDVWSENKDRMTGNGGKKVVIQTEPQLWYNIIPGKFSAGTEIEMTNNFYPYNDGGFTIYPTVAVKYNF